MAYYRKLPSGRWRAEVEVAGHRETQGGFPTKREAQEWATQTEADLRAGRLGKWPLKTLGDALDRYQKEISVTKASRVFEERRFEALKRDFPELVARRQVFERFTDARPLAGIPDREARAFLQHGQHLHAVALVAWIHATDAAAEAAENGGQPCSPCAAGAVMPSSRSRCSLSAS